MAKGCVTNLSMFQNQYTLPCHKLRKLVSFMYIYTLSSERALSRVKELCNRMAKLALLQRCEKRSCDYKITNGLTDVKDILLAMSNHLAAMHPSSQMSM